MTILSLHNGKVSRLNEGQISITDKQGIKIVPKFDKMFSKFKEKGIRICAFTAAKLIHTYNHECISNILNAAGVSAN